jgi:hypothetical protein
VTDREPMDSSVLPRPLCPESRPKPNSRPRSHRPDGRPPLGLRRPLCQHFLRSAFTGSQGVTIEEFKALLEWHDLIEFGF